MDLLYLVLKTKQKQKQKQKQITYKEVIDFACLLAKLQMFIK